MVLFLMNGSYYLLTISVIFLSFNNILARLLLWRARLVTLRQQALARTRMSTGSTAFATTHRVINRVHGNPLTLGRRPNQRERPALPDFSSAWSEFPTLPTVALHAAKTLRTSPEGNLIIAYLSSRDVNWAKVPAERTIAAPCPRTQFNVMNNRTQGDVLHRQRISNFRSHVSSGNHFLTNLQSVRCKDVPFFSIGIESNAIRAERFGSYSIVFTVAGTPSLLRLKSITLYFLLCPPPM